METEDIDWQAIDEKFAYLYETDWMKERPPGVKKAYEDFPPWYFYVTKDGDLPKRVYGFLETGNGEVRAHTISAMAFICNDTIGGSPLDSLERVHKWSDANLQRIAICGHPSVFTDPYGWVEVVMSNN